MKNKNLNEEINRIKSLFTEERLYGNLSEQKFDSDEFFNPENFLNTTYPQDATRVEKSFIKDNSYLDLYNLIDKGERTFIRENKFYKTYINAINNWNKVYKDFGWEKQKIISGFDSLNGALPNTIINPTDLLKSLFELFKATKPNLDKLNEQFEYNFNWDSNATPGGKPTMSSGDININLKDVDNGKLYTHKGDPYEYKYHEKDDSWFTRKKGSNGKWIELDKVEYVGVIDKLEKRFFGEDWVNNRNLTTYFEYLENIIQPHNQLIVEQSIKLLNKVCGRVQIGVTEISSGQYSNYTEIITESLKIVCKNNGGVFMYKQGRSNYFCRCVDKMEGVIDVKKESYGIGSGETFKVDLEKLPTNVVDVRGSVQKVIEWGVDCADDWHCIADLASIAVLLVPGVGLPLSGLIDLVSAIGYVVEQEDGWELMAGLTILGTIFSFGEAKSLVKGGKGFSKKLMDLNNILTKKESKNIKYLRIREWSKNLTKEEKKLYKEYRKLLQRLEKNPNILKNLSNDFNSLNNTEKGYLKNFLKGKTDDEISKLYKESRYDLKELVKKLIKNVSIRDSIIQSTFFVGMFVLSEDIKKQLEKLYENYGLDPFDIFDELGKIQEKHKKRTEQIQRRLKNIHDLNTTNHLEEMNKNLKKINDDFEMKTTFSQEDRDLISEFLKKIPNDEVKQTFKDTVNGIAHVDNGIDMLKNEIKKFNEIKPITVDSLEILNDDLISLNKKIEPLKNNIYKINENMKLNEEINRIKSLFGDDRLYGNLVNEQKTNGCTEDEAISLLRSKGYTIGGESNNPCYDKNKSDIGKVISSVGNKYDVDITIPKGADGGSIAGCSIQFNAKNKSARFSKFISLVLFDDGNTKQFSIYFKFEVEDGYPRIIDIGGGFKIQYLPTSNKTYSVNKTNKTGEVGGEIRYAKIDGNWTINSGEIKFYNSKFITYINQDGDENWSFPEKIKTFLPDTYKIKFRDPNSSTNQLEINDFLKEKNLDLSGIITLPEMINLLK